MFQGKKKAVTFSFDDGVEQDGRLIQILDKYGLKCTFNLNSGLLGKDYSGEVHGKYVEGRKFPAEKIRATYEGHEVAVHTLTHPRLTTLTDGEIAEQVLKDRRNLSALVGYDVRGMAYPGGGENNDARVAAVVKRCGIAYARTVQSTYTFDLQENLLRFNPTVYYREREACYRLAEEFLTLRTEEPKILYIWGHAYEMDWEEDGWENIERLCKLLAGKEDIFYGTNSAILLSADK